MYDNCAMEKIRKGMHVLIREGTAERNLKDLIPIVTPSNSWHFSFATDDKHPDDLLEEGHIDHCLRKAISLGMDPVTAFQIASINTSNHYRLKNAGAIKPRYWADFVLMSDYKKVAIEAVYKKGKSVSFTTSGIPVHQIAPPSIRGTMNPGEISIDDFKIKALGKKIKVIDILPGQIVTDTFVAHTNEVDGFVKTDVDNDILKIVVIERHMATGRIGKAFVHGFGLKSGAMGSTVAHDAHNIVIVGTNDQDMFEAFKQLKKIQGGLVVFQNQKNIAQMPLPIAGLLSNQSFENTAQNLKQIKEKVKTLGGTHESPFMILSFLCLSPIPRLKVTDLGLIDVDTFEVTSLFADDMD